MTAVALGRVPGRRMVNKFGRNGDIDTGTVPEDVWFGGGVYTGWSSAAQTVNVTSDSAQDAAGGTGCQVLHIEGLTGSGVEVQEDVTLTGAVAAVSTNSYLRLYRAYVRGCGTDETNAGEITIAQSTSGDVMAAIEAGVGQTQLALYTIPAGYRGVITKIYAVCRRAASGSWERQASINLRTREPGYGWRERRPTAVSPSATTLVHLDGGIMVPELTDIVIRVDAVSHSNTEVSGGFDVLLVATG